MNATDSNPPAPEPTPPNPGGNPAAANPAVIATCQVYVTHFELKTPEGQSYLEGGARKLIKADAEPLAQFLADADITRVEGSQKRDVRILYRFGNLPATQWRPMRFITQSMLDAFEKAAREFYRKAHAGGDGPQFQKLIRSGFRLPDPDLEPEAYWLVGDRFNPRLVILWGAEKLDSDKKPIPSIPLVDDAELFPGRPDTVVKKLRSRLMDWPSIMQENLALIVERKEPIGRFLARPVLDQEHEKIVGLSPILTPDAVFPISRFKPINKLFTPEINAFDKAAELFYAKAHENAPNASLYERELRRSFRLPKLEAAKAKAERSPEFEGLSEEKESDAPVPKTAYWVYGKKLAPRVMVAVAGNEPQESCLHLRKDKLLNIPPGASAKPATIGLEPVKPTPQTIVDQLREREQTIFATALKGTGCLLALGILAFFVLHLYYTQLKPTSAQIANDPAQDPDNSRRLIALAFNTAISPPSPENLGQTFAIEPASKDETTTPDPGRLKVLSAKTAKGNVKQLLLSLNDRVEDGEKLRLVLNGLKPVFGRPLKKNTTILIDTRDSRPPTLVDADSSPDSDKKLLLKFDEKIDPETANHPEQLTIPGVTIESVALDETNNTLVVTRDRPFEIKKTYTVTAHSIKDASQKGNAFKEQDKTFVYGDRPPTFVKNGVGARKDDQLTVTAVFNKALDPLTATNPANYNFGTSGLKPGRVTLLADNRTVEIQLTNSHMKPNQNYTLYFKGVKSVSGNSGEGNAAFNYTGKLAALPTYDIVPAKYTIDIVFSKPMNADNAKFRLEQNLRGDWQPVEGRITVQHDQPAVIHLKLSSMLTKLKYRLTWTNMFDEIGNLSAEIVDFKPSPLSKDPSFRSASRSGRAITLLASYLTQIKASSLSKDKFVIKGLDPLTDQETGTIPVAAIIVKSNDNRPLSDGTPYWRAEFVLTATSDLPKNVRIYWHNVEVEDEPQPYNELSTESKLELKEK